MKISHYIVGFTLAFAATGTSAQGLEDVLRGIAATALREVLQGVPAQSPAPGDSSKGGLPVEPLYPGGAASGSISADQALAIVREAGYRERAGFSVFQSPFEGYWMYGTTSELINPVLISKNGRWVAGISSFVLERLPRGKSRELSASERQEFFRGVLMTLKPGAAIALNPSAPRSPIVVTAPDCPACIRLDLMARTVHNLPVRLVPASLAGNSGEVYSRIMCDASPRRAFEHAIDSRARVLPLPVTGCDERLSQLAISELLWAIAQPGGGRRSYPTLFTADGQIRPLQFDSAATLRKSLAQAEF